MNRETEILLKRARALPEDQRRELLDGLLRSLTSSAVQPGEVRERVSTYDANRGQLEVVAFWDPEKSVWLATSDDVADLDTEAANLGDLVRELSTVIPKLLEASGKAAAQQSSFELRASKIPLVAEERAPAEATPAQRYPSMAEFRASLGMPMLTSNPVLDMREEERY